MKREEIIKELSKNKSTLLAFPDRGPWGQSSFRGNCSGYIQAFLMWVYKTRYFCELFAGSGTGSDVAKDMGVKYLGADLNPNPKRSDILVVDAIKDDVPDEFRNADMLFMHPPYGLPIQIPYAGYQWEDPDGTRKTSDLGQMPWEEFMATLNKIIMKYYAALPDQARMAILMGDVRRQGKFYSMFADVIKPGSLEQIITKCQFNVWSENRKYANYNFIPIVTETLMVIKKVGNIKIFYSVPQKFIFDIRDSVSATWEDLVMATMRELKTAAIDKIYSFIEGFKKTKNNPNWKAKVRQTLQRLRDKGLVYSNQRGVWQAA